MANPSLFDLAGKKALVTGAGVGIGRACALALAGAGADEPLTFQRFQVTVQGRAIEQQKIGKLGDGN